MSRSNASASFLPQNNNFPAMQCHNSYQVPHLLKAARGVSYQYLPCTATPLPYVLGCRSLTDLGKVCPTSTCHAQQCLCHSQSLRKILEVLERLLQLQSHSWQRLEVQTSMRHVPHTAHPAICKKRMFWKCLGGYILHIPHDASCHSSSMTFDHRHSKQWMHYFQITQKRV